MNHHLLSLPLLESVVGCRGLGGLGTTTGNPGSSRVRAAVESVIVFHLTPALTSQLRELKMMKSFVSTIKEKKTYIAFICVFNKVRYFPLSPSSIKTT